MAYRVGGRAGSNVATAPAQRDEDLVERVRTAGDQEAFMALVERHQGRIYRLAFRLTRNRADAEDVTQEVFLTAYTKLHHFRGDASFFTWLYRIAVNACYASVRSGKRDRSVSLDSMLPRFKRDGHHAFIPPDMAYAGRDWTSGADGILLRKELRALIEEALALMPAGMRAVYVLRELEGLSNEDTARALKVTLQSVKSRLHRARLLVHGRLTKYFEERA